LLRVIEDSLDHYSPPAPDSRSGFRYSYTEITTRGSSGYVRAKQTRYENGRLVTEECEGPIDYETCQRAVEDAQYAMQEQMNQAMKLFFLPWWSRHDK
jgi:hypothetical protein